jgi:enterochelin esterase-like enzyme
VLYVHAGAQALDLGKLNEAFDRLGEGVGPFLAVFIRPVADPRAPLNQDAEAYTKDMVERVVPFVDRTYKTDTGAAARVSFGGGFGGYFAFHTALRRPDVFGRVATHSAFLFESDLPEFEAVLPAADKGPQIAYFDWGAYDNRAEHEGWDVGKGNRRFREVLKAKGYQVENGGELPEGATWGNWQSRAERVMKLLFPNP